MNIEEPAFRHLVSTASSRIELWARVLRAADVETMLEVGVWKGEYAAAILEQCPFIRRYYMIDPWANLPDWNKPCNASSEVFGKAYEQAMGVTDFASSKRVVLRGRTKEMVASIPDKSLDFAYIDGDHTLRGITIDLVRLLPKLKEGGILGGDDFTDTPWQHDPRYEPTLVCPFSVYFAEAMDLPIMALPFNQFILQKRHESSFEFIDTTGKHRNLCLNRLPTEA
jgi:predicted O-methyltransferase YrrM